MIAAARDKARVSVTKGTYVAPSTLTVGEWPDRWLAGQLKPSTEASYRRKIDTYLKSTIGGERLQALSPSRLSAVFRQLGESGGKGGKALSPRSVQYVRAIMNKAMADAVVDRVLEVNPVTGSKAPRRDGKPKHTTWTPEQQRAFLKASEGDRWRVVWVVALASGERRGELCGKAWADVDLDSAILAVERSATQVGNERVCTTPKNHERRRFALDPVTVAELRAWRKQQAAERLQAGEAWQDTDGLLFTWPDGSPVMPDYLTKEFPKAVKRAETRMRAERGKPIAEAIRAQHPGISDEELASRVERELDRLGVSLPRMSLHGTRHTHATTLLREGVPVHVVSKRLGHKDRSVTLNVYADAIPEDDDRAVAVFSRAVWGA